MYAVVSVGGKQAKVEKGSLLAVEKLDETVGATVSLPVLMIADGDRVLATPSEIAGASVTAEVLEHFKGEKQMIFKFKKRKGYKRTKGHRQNLTSVRILEIVAEGAPAKPAKSAKPAKASKVEPAPVAAEKVEAVAAIVEAPAEAVVETVAVEAPAEVVVETVADSSAAETAQCAAIKADGSRCANKAKEGSEYCGVHAKKYEG